MATSGSKDIEMSGAGEGVAVGVPLGDETQPVVLPPIDQTQAMLEQQRE